ncbi:AAA ATPase domain-containing protein [Selenomonas ruminantium]|uniref:AAA ATPase domain-containing protein n=1 Tax=Selenomonas ruminantium TaxID=971 RepID=A0A1M6TEU1_SELRU|nr:AAA family ATPase [Selenomonas ruminantium]SHK55490.1 AAA ATPase domain-containing protein [Selenomonas ruminantium]
MIEKFSIDLFKSLRNVTLELSNLNIFIGANGVGKTNILEALGVVSAASYGAVDDESLMRRGIRPGVPRLYKTSNERYETSPHISFLVENARCRYNVSLLNPLDNPLPKWNFKTEKVWSNGTDIYHRGENSNISSDIGGIPAVLASETIEPHVLEFLSDLRSYGLYTPNTPALRGMMPDMQSRVPVGLSGGGLSEGLRELLDLAEDDDRIDEAIDNVISLFDWVDGMGTSTQDSRIISPSLPRTKRTIVFRDAYMKKITIS